MYRKKWRKEESNEIRNVKTKKPIDAETTRKLRE
jgi:hypothetical protein